jgi:hypothetical protein
VGNLVVVPALGRVLHQRSSKTRRSRTIHGEIEMKSAQKIFTRSGPRGGRYFHQEAFLKQFSSPVTPTIKPKKSEDNSRYSGELLREIRKTHR